MKNTYQKYFPIQLKSAEIIDFNAKNSQLFSLYLNYSGVWKLKINGKKVPLMHYYQVGLNKKGAIYIELWGWFRTIKKNILVKTNPLHFEINKDYSKIPFDKKLIPQFTELKKTLGHNLTEYQPKEKNIYLKKKLLMKPTIKKEKIEVQLTTFKHFNND